MHDVIRFKNLSKFDDLVHGISTRKSGDMRESSPESRNALRLFSQKLDLSPANIIRMQQVHSSNVQWVTEDQVGWKMLQTDGLLTEEDEVFLSVVSADCLPILLYDSKKKICGAIHAGWRGIHSEIIREAISMVKSEGSDPKTIFAGIGPCIRSCCYKVDDDRIALFKKKFKHFPGFITNRDGAAYLNLPSLAVSQIMACGVPEENIEDCGICTYDNPDLLFSFRREGEDFGEFIGIIGRR